MEIWESGTLKRTEYFNSDEKLEKIDLYREIFSGMASVILKHELPPLESQYQLVAKEKDLLNFPSMLSWVCYREVYYLNNDGEISKTEYYYIDAIENRFYKEVIDGNYRTQIYGAKRF
jgi:hypothetical protein